MRNRESLLLRILVLSGLVATTAPAVAAPLYVDFGSYSAAPTSTFGAAAGLPGVWNNVAALGTTSNVLDAFGAVTDVDITLAAESADGTGGFGTTDAHRLLQDNFYTTPGKIWSVTVAGLTNGLYDVYLYEPMNLFLGSGGGSVNGVRFSSINGNFYGSLAEGTNYLLLTSVLVSDGTLVASGGDLSAPNGLAGMQLVDRSPAPAAVPEPAVLPLLGLALVAACVRHPRK